jgi:hypothetical protein
MLFSEKAQSYMQQEDNLKCVTMCDKRSQGDMDLLSI